MPDEAARRFIGPGEIRSLTGLRIIAAMWVVVFPVLVGSLALHDTGIVKSVSTPWMVHGGRISYSLYLVHIPVFEIFWSAMTRRALAPGTALATFLIPQVLLLAVLLGHLCYAYIEEPARVWLRRKGTRSATERLTPVLVAAGP